MLRKASGNKRDFIYRDKSIVSEVLTNDDLAEMLHELLDFPAYEVNKAYKSYIGHRIVKAIFHYLKRELLAGNRIILPRIGYMHRRTRKYKGKQFKPTPFAPPQQNERPDTITEIVLVLNQSMRRALYSDPTPDGNKE